MVSVSRSSNNKLGLLRNLSLNKTTQNSQENAAENLPIPNYATAKPENTKARTKNNAKTAVGTFVSRVKTENSQNVKQSVEKIEINRANQIMENFKTIDERIKAKEEEYAAAQNAEKEAKAKSLDAQKPLNKINSNTNRTKASGEAKTDLNEEKKAADEAKAVYNNAKNNTKRIKEELNNLKKEAKELTILAKNAQAAIDSGNTYSTPKSLNELKTLLSSDEERAFLDEMVKKNMSDETALQHDNGKPKYIIAKGTSDRQFHIYETKLDKDGNITAGKSVVNVKKGNNNMSGFKECDECSCSGLEYYYLDRCEGIASRLATYNTASPLALDMNGDGVKISDKTVEYDIDADGKIDKIFDSADAVLVFDKNGDGVSGSNGSEVFGNNTDLNGDGKADGFKDGFEALKALAKREGMINGADDNELDVSDIKKLEEKYGFKVKLNGYNSESTSLSDAGITSIKLSKDENTTLTKNFDGKGNMIMTQKGATFTVDGQEKEYADIWHKKLEDASKTEAKTNSKAKANASSGQSAIALSIQNSKKILNDKTRRK